MGGERRTPLLGQVLRISAGSEPSGHGKLWRTRFVHPQVLCPHPLVLSGQHLAPSWVGLFLERIRARTGGPRSEEGGRDTDCNLSEVVWEAGNEGTSWDGLHQKRRDHRRPDSHFCLKGACTDSAFDSWHCSRGKAAPWPRGS